MEKTPVVYFITGIIPYSGGDRSVVAVYLDKEKAEKRYEDERNDDTYIDVQMDCYETDG
jgi:hypothetical protein